MNPLFKAIVGSLLRHSLTALASYLVTRGIWTEEEAATIVGAAVIALVGVGWAVLQKYATHWKLLDALDAPAGTSLDDLNRSRR